MAVSRAATRYLKAPVHGLAFHCNRVGLNLKRRKWSRTSAGRALVDAVLFPADIYKIAMGYRDAFGHFPDLIRPRTFNEWLQRSKLVNRKWRYRAFADKILVRDFVRERIGSDVLTNLVWTGTDLSEARKRALPDKFVIKTNNGSGTNLIVTDAASLDWHRAQTQTREWMEHDHSVHYGEWQYRWIEPRLLIEEFLEGTNGGVPVDYKFFCFHGKVRIVQVDLDRFQNHTRLLCDHTFSPLPVALHYPRAMREVSKPASFRRMVEIAEALSADEPFLRVDLYDANGPKFGELTLHPGSGLERFTPPEWDRRLFDFLHAAAMPASDIAVREVA